MVLPGKLSVWRDTMQSLSFLAGVISVVLLFAGIWRFTCSMSGKIDSTQPAWSKVCIIVAPLIQIGLVITYWYWPAVHVVMNLFQIVLAIITLDLLAGFLATLLGGYKLNGEAVTFNSRDSHAPL